MVLTGGDFSPSRDILQYLETFLIATNGGYYWYVVGKNKNSAKHPKIHRTDDPYVKKQKTNTKIINNDKIEKLWASCINVYIGV